MVILQVADATLLTRVLGRRMDPETGKIYHIEVTVAPSHAVARALLSLARAARERAG